MDASPRNLGSCCACEQSGPTVRNVMQLDFLAPDGFSGWGCVVCDIPMRGAIAVLCDACLAGSAEPRFIATGHYLTEGKRQALENYPRVAFGHIEHRHPELHWHGFDEPTSMWPGAGPFPVHDPDFDVPAMLEPLCSLELPINACVGYRDAQRGLTRNPFPMESSAAREWAEGYDLSIKDGTARAPAREPRK